MDVKEDLTTFWKTKGAKLFPKIKEVVAILSTIPCGSASVERSFSITNLVLDERRRRLGDEYLKKILFIKQNYFKFFNK